MAEWCRICGKPIDKSGNSHACRDGRILNVRGGLTVDDLKDSTKEILNDPELRKTMAESLERIKARGPEVYRLEGQGTFEQLKPKPKRNRAAYMRSYRKGSKRGG